MPAPIIIVQGGAGCYEKIMALKSANVLADGVKSAASTGYRYKSTHF